MREKGVSRLDAYRAMIEVHLRNGVSVAEIRRRLQDAGCKITHTALSGWIKGHFEKTTPSESQLGSLGLLDDLPSDGEGDKGRRLFLLRILLEPEILQDPEQLSKMLKNVSFVIPVKYGEPSFTEYARSLGRVRLNALGDMDYILLAMWTKPMREMMTRGKVVDPLEWRRRARRLIEVAFQIREEMRSAIP
jgi:hypothetical protein